MNYYQGEVINQADNSLLGQNGQGIPFSFAAIAQDQYDNYQRFMQNAINMQLQNAYALRPQPTKLERAKQFLTNVPNFILSGR